MSDHSEGICLTPRKKKKKKRTLESRGGCFCPPSPFPLCRPCHLTGFRLISDRKPRLARSSHRRCRSQPSERIGVERSQRANPPKSPRFSFLHFGGTSLLRPWKYMYLPPHSQQGGPEVPTSRAEWPGPSPSQIEKYQETDVDRHATFSHSTSGVGVPARSFDHGTCHARSCLSRPERTHVGVCLEIGAPQYRWLFLCFR